MTPDEAREVLLIRAERERPEERWSPPSWAPFSAMHPAREVLASREAARSRVDHVLELAELPDRVLARMLADGWSPERR